MEFSGFLLYPIMALILLWMWYRVKGMSIEDIVRQSSEEHHMLVEVFDQHPQGGDWTQYQQWVDDHHR